MYKFSQKCTKGLKNVQNLDARLFILWFLRQKCAYFAIFETQLRDGEFDHQKDSAIFGIHNTSQTKVNSFLEFFYWRKRRPWTKKGTHIQKRSPVGPRYPEGDPFGNNASVGSLFWVSICSSAACFPGSGLNEELGKMEEPGLNLCRARFAIVSSTCCNFFAFFLPPALNQHLIAACQCQNKSLVHFLLQEKAIFQSQFLKKRAKN